MLTKKYSWSMPQVELNPCEIEYWDDEGNLVYLCNDYASEQEAIEALDKFLSAAGWNWWTCEKFTLDCVYVYSA